jgi:hypothetical protein
MSSRSILVDLPAIAHPVGLVARDIVRHIARALGAPFLVASACAGDPPTLAPMVVTQPPAVVVIPPSTVTSTPTLAPEPVAVTTAPAASATPEQLRSFQPVRLGRWRTAVDGYAPSVNAGNTTALNAARAPFATYLVAMHRRIHPVFADHFLGALGNLPQGHPLNGDLSTRLEIVLAKETGKLVRMGVTKTSGVTVFDIGALDAVDRAAPFGKAPDAIASPDGNVYLEWEFHRNPIDACSPINARPYVLKSVP